MQAPACTAAYPPLCLLPANLQASVPLRYLQLAVRRAAPVYLKHRFRPYGYVYPALKVTTVPGEQA